MLKAKNFQCGEVVQVAETCVGNPGKANIEFLQSCELFQMQKTCISHLRAADVEPLEVRQPMKIRQPDICYIRFEGRSQFLDIAAAMQSGDVCVGRHRYLRVVRFNHEAPA